MKSNALIGILSLTILIQIAQPFPLSGYQQKEKRAESYIQKEVTVTLKLVHVIVTDRRGNTIKDIQKDEFILFDNGHEMKITDYENHTLPIFGKELQAPEVTVIETPIPKPTPMLKRTFLFLFDFVFADPGGLKLAREAALRFLDTGLDPTTELGVYSFSGGRNLHVLHPPDKNYESARQAIEEIGLHSLFPIAPIRPAAESQAITLRSGDSSANSFPSTTTSRQNVGRIVAGNFIWALESLAQALRYAPGRKIIILYSNGLHPSYLSRGAFLDTGNADLGMAYKDVCDHLSAADTSVFAVNTEENTYFITPESDKGVIALREISARTGGRFSGNAYTAPDHLERIETLSSTYYVLGYPIEERWDGRFHNIRVKVTRPNCEVSAQTGYFAAKPFPKYSSLEKQIHLVDLALSEKPLSQEPVRFTMQALPWASNPPDDIRFIAEVPVSRLGDVAGPRLEAVSLVFNELDEIVDTHRTELDLSGPEIGGKSVFFHSALSAPPGAYKCRVVLRNMESGRAAVAAASTIVPGPKPDEITLFPPLFLVSKGQPTYLDSEAPKGKKSGSAAEPAGAGLFRGLPVESKKYSPLFDRPLSSDQEILVIAYCAAREKTAADLKFSANLKSASSGEAIGLPLAILADKAEKRGRSFLLSLTLPGTLSGGYSLILSAEAQGLKSGVVRKIQIE